MTWPGEKIEKIEEIEGDQTEEKRKEQSEDHLGRSHDHIHFCGRKISEIFSQLNPKQFCYRIERNRGM